jgi:hypothetical protein
MQADASEGIRAPGYRGRDEPRPGRDRDAVPRGGQGLRHGAGRVAYEPVDEATRAETVKALRLHDRGGRIELRAARSGGLTLGVRGCRAILLSAQEAKAVESLVTAAFGG